MAKIGCVDNLDEQISIKSSLDNNVASERSRNSVIQVSQLLLTI